MTRRRPGQRVKPKRALGCHCPAVGNAVWAHTMTSAIRTTAFVPKGAETSTSRRPKGRMHLGVGSPPRAPVAGVVAAAVIDQLEAVGQLKALGILHHIGEPASICAAGRWVHRVARSKFGRGCDCRPR